MNGDAISAIGVFSRLDNPHVVGRRYFLFCLNLVVVVQDLLNYFSISLFNVIGDRDELKGIPIFSYLKAIYFLR